MSPLSLQSLVSALAPPLAFAGIAVARGASAPDYILAAANERVVRSGTNYRAASISKIITGEVFRRAATARGVFFPYDVDVSDVLGYRLRHPAFPDHPITVRMIAAHHAGLDDSGGYLLPADSHLADWLAQGEVWGHAAPGTRFCYSNLGYVIVAACAEALAGRSFGDMSAEVLRDIGVEGGFNWWGVSNRESRIPAYRPSAGGFVAQIDNDVPAQGLIQPDGTAIAMEGYTPGVNPSRFSPQGGLRISLAGSLRIAKAIGAGKFDTRPLWTRDMGETLGAPHIFQSYGLGLQIYDNPTFYPRPLIGHFAGAYGFSGGLWWDGQAGLAFAYALNGLPDLGETDDFSAAEHQIFAAVTGTVS